MGDAIQVAPSKPAEPAVTPESLKGTDEQISSKVTRVSVATTAEAAPAAPPKAPAETPEVPPASKTGEEEAPATEETTEETPQVPPKVDLDSLIDSYAESFQKNGNKLSEDDYKALEAKGVSKKTADTIIAGRQAQAQAFSRDLEE